MKRMKQTRMWKILPMVLICAMFFGAIPIYADNSSSGDQNSAQGSNIYVNALNSSADLLDFKAYYAKDARTGLTETSLDHDWTISEKGVSRSIKPDNIGGYWQSNVDKSGEYGYLAELVYTTRQYVDFELEVDAMQVAESISRGIGIGFGKTEPGAFFVDGDNNMKAAGGAYAYVKRGGETAIWGYAQDTVNGANGKLGNDGRKLGTAVKGGSACSTWHTIKICVEDGKASMWIKAQGAADNAYQQVVSNVALKNYEGGYISLMTNANGAFKNLKIKDLKDTKRFRFDDADSLKKFTAYYADDAKKGLAAAKMEENWTVTADGILERVQPAGKQYWMSNANVYEQNGVGIMEYGLVSELVYNARQYVDFELEVDVRNITGISRMAAIGFGRKNPKEFFLGADGSMNYDGGAYAILNRSSNTSSMTGIWGYLENTVGSDGTALAGTNVRVNGIGKEAIDGWHHVKLRVQDGTVTMWVGEAQVVTAALKNYTGGYIVLHTSANGAFDNLVITDLGTPEYPELTAVSKVADSVVAIGTKSKDIAFPSTVTVTDENEKIYTAPVTFFCEDYDPDKVGVYTFTGEIDLSRLPLSNSNHIVVNAVVEVESLEMTERTVRIDFDSEECLKDFTSYYADDVKSGYELSEKQANWTITADGTLKRIKPEGKEFWWSNLTEYKDTGIPAYKYFNVGMMEYGLMANLIYIAKEYTNFVLDVDVKAPTDITRQVMVGFGQREKGVFFIDQENIMNRDGGVYAYLSRSGETALFGYLQNTVNNKTGTSGNNVRVLGDKIDYKPGEWAHMRLVVNGQNATVYMNGTEVVSASLKGYFGGYISLVTNAGAEYDNLKIVDMGDGCTNEIAEVEKLSGQTVFVGIQVSEYYLPSHVMVTCADGLQMAVAVEWECDGFSVYNPGDYTFVGTLKAKEAGLRNPDNLTAALQISVKKLPVGADTAIFTFDDMTSLNSFVSTYALDASKTENFAVVDPAKYWEIDENGRLSRLDDRFQYAPNAEYNKVASLTYAAKKYRDFELNVDYVHGSLTSKWAMVAFGQDKAGTFACNDDGGILAYVEREGQPVFWGDVYEGNSRRIRNESDLFSGYYAKDNAGHMLAHHMRLVVAGGYAYMYIDDYEPIITQLPDSYDGGYISLICNTNVKYDNLMITDLKDGHKQNIVSVERFDNEILDGVVNLPRFLTVTTDAGYQYECPVTWASSDYDSTKTGTYSFIGKLTLPFENLANPNDIKGLVKVKHTIDYNPRDTVKYYFDSAMDLKDFECFYASSVDTGFRVVDPLEKYTITEDGWLYRINENFSRAKDPKDEQTDKIAILTYKGGTYDNFELNVDIKNGKKTYFWAMIGFGQTKAGTFVTQEGGGYYAYTEREGRPVFWGPIVNVNHEKDRLRAGDLWYDDFKPFEEHHLRLVVCNGTASLYVDDYAVPLVAELSDDYIGGYISLISGANDVSFNNLSITRLEPEKDVEYENEQAVDLLHIKVTDTKGNENKNQPGTDNVKGNDIQKKNHIVPIVFGCAVGCILAAVIIAVVVVIKKQRKEGKENEEKDD